MTPLQLRAIFVHFYKLESPDIYKSMHVIMRPNHGQLRTTSYPPFRNFDEATETTLIAPPSCKFGDSPAAAAEKWVHNCRVFRDKPSLMTTRLLISALQNQPPIHVVQFILSVNPKAASIPKYGPTPLQVAVEKDSSIAVVTCLLRSCPFALCVTNPEHPQDPLSFAKQHRKDDKALIDLLSQPLSFWMTERGRDPDASLTSFAPPEAVNRVVTPLPPPKCSKATAVDREELDNVKLLCAQVIKGHKNLAKQVATCQDKLEDARVDKSQILKELHEEQKKHFYRQLVALDMKERTMQLQMRRMEERCAEHCESTLQGWTRGLHLWKSSADVRMKESRALLDREIQVNAQFRSDVAQWMDDEQSTGTPETAPFVFATPLEEHSERWCLFPKGALDHMKRRQWQPLFRQWDRIMLNDDDDHSSRDRFCL
jgi:hypothetical protein